MRKLFGTDGIRSRAGEFPLDDATMFALGQALAHRLQSPDVPRPRVILGMDTRESGPGIARALMAGLISAGGEPVFAGVVPTPAVAFLCKDSNAEAGISISASHNPFHDNGVKIFGRDGMKMSDGIEKAIEDELMERRSDAAPAIENVDLSDSNELIERYERFLLHGVDPSLLRGRRIVLDTGHGAVHRLAGEVFRRAGADPIVINAAPDGRNINEQSGALHPEKLAEVVRREGADFGVAFDGDADRAIFVDDQGNIRNGDEILYIWASHEQRKGELRNGLVVATVMSNFGFEKQLSDDGIRLLRAAVGDKYVLETMLEHGAILGGEQSGHLIDLRVHTTGDGLHTALAFATILSEQGQPFSQLPTFKPMPQILLNERVAARPPLDSLPRYTAAAAEATRQLGDSGRILVRYSGTENLVRVMVEGEDEALIGHLAEQLRETLRDEIAGA